MGALAQRRVRGDGHHHVRPGDPPPRPSTPGTPAAGSSGSAPLVSTPHTDLPATVPVCIRSAVIGEPAPPSNSSRRVHVPSQHVRALYSPNTSFRRSAPRRRSKIEPRIALVVGGAPPARPSPAPPRQAVVERPASGSAAAPGTARRTEGSHGVSLLRSSASVCAVTILGGVEHQPPGEAGERRVQGRRGAERLGHHRGGFLGSGWRTSSTCSRPARRRRQATELWRGRGTRRRGARFARGRRGVYGSLQRVGERRAHTGDSAAPPPKRRSQNAPPMNASTNGTSQATFSATPSITARTRWARVCLQPRPTHACTSSLGAGAMSSATATTARPTTWPAPTPRRALVYPPGVGGRLTPCCSERRRGRRPSAGTTSAPCRHAAPGHHVPAAGSGLARASSPAPMSPLVEHVGDDCTAAGADDHAPVSAQRSRADSRGDPVDRAGRLECRRGGLARSPQPRSAAANPCIGRSGQLGRADAARRPARRRLDRAQVRFCRSSKRPRRRLGGACTCG